jgi:hypothetical protein
LPLRRKADMLGEIARHRAQVLSGARASPRLSPSHWPAIIRTLAADMTASWERLRRRCKIFDARRFVNVVASHFYGAPDDRTWSEFAAASRRNGLPVWMN